MQRQQFPAVEKENGSPRRPDVFLIRTNVRVPEQFWLQIVPCLHPDLMLPAEAFLTVCSGAGKLFVRHYWNDRNRLR